MPTNEAQTIWKPSIGEGEYVSGNTNNIDDPSGNLLVDPSGVQIVDTGVTFNQVPTTVWAASPGN